MANRILAILFSSLLFAFLLPSISFADSGETTISGLVTEKGSPVKDAQVIVVCNKTTENTITNLKGIYEVVFKENKCPMGSTVSVSASYKGESGDNEKKINCQTNIINIALVNVPQVPEFNAITDTGALIMGGAVFLAVRKREVSGQKV